MEDCEEFFSTYDSPFGRILLRYDDECITGLWFKDIPEIVPKTVNPVVRESVEWLDTYFSGTDPGPTPPLKATGTLFETEVWNILRTIPYGTATTYGAIAKKIAENRNIPKMSAQAVGNAVGSNPISVMVPCHRVIGADRSLVGYEFGLRIKSDLLELEGIEFRKVQS